MLDSKELLFNELYEKTKDCSRTQFIKLLMQKDRENQELKKQLGNIEEELELVRCDLHNRTSERDGSERELNECLSQQKEFIKHLEDEIKQINPKILDDGELNLRLDDIKYTQYLIYKQILQKYKETIGVSDEESNNIPS